MTIDTSMICNNPATTTLAIFELLEFYWIHNDFNINHITGYETYYKSTSSGLHWNKVIKAMRSGVTGVFIAAKGLDPLSRCHRLTWVFTQMFRSVRSFNIWFLLFAACIVYFAAVWSFWPSFRVTHVCETDRRSAQTYTKDVRERS